MIQPFWRYISKSYSLCPSLLIPDMHNWISKSKQFPRVAAWFDQSKTIILSSTFWTSHKMYDRRYEWKSILLKNTFKKVLTFTSITQSQLYSISCLRLFHWWPRRCFSRGWCPWLWSRNCTHRGLCSYSAADIFFWETSLK